MATVSTQVHPSPSKERNGFPDFCLHIPKNVNTLAGFRAWVLAEDFPEHLRVTFLHGEVYLDMSKENLDTHADVKTEVYRIVIPLNHDLDLGKIYTDGVLITNAEAGVSNNPDGVCLLWESLESGRVRLVGKRGNSLEIEGSPDWAMEVVSDSSVDKDTRLLRPAYHQARIQEYWLIDARKEEISFQILYWRKSGYVAAPNKDGWQRSKIFGRSFKLTRKPARQGLWRYTLLVQD